MTCVVYRVCSAQPLLWKQLPAPCVECIAAKKPASLISARRLRKNRASSRPCGLAAASSAIATRPAKTNPRPSSVCSYDFHHFVVPDHTSMLVYTDVRRQISSVIRPNLDPNPDVTPSINPKPSVPDPNLPTPAENPTPVTFPTPEGALPVNST